MSETNTRALEQLFPHMNVEEIHKQRSLNEEMITYVEIEGTPFTRAWVKENNKHYLLMGKTKMETNGFDSIDTMMNWMINNSWTLSMRVASTVCRDMIQPYIQWKAAQEAGLQINKPEVTNQNQ